MTNQKFVNFQDVCHAATEGKWKFLKHILLAATLATSVLEQADDNHFEPAPAL